MFYGICIKNRKQLVVLVATQLFMILAFRNTMLGVDLPNYIRAYEYYRTLSFKDVLLGFRPFGDADISLRTESGYLLFAWMIGKLGIDFHGFLVICAAVCMTSVARFIYLYSQKPGMSFLLYIALGGYSLLFGILRQSLGFAVFLCAIPAIQKKRLYKYLGICYLATLFHSIFWLTFPLYFLAQKKIKKVHIVATIGISLGIVSIMPGLRTVLHYVMVLFGRRDYIIYEFNWNNMYLLMNLFAIALCFLYKKDLGEKNQIFYWGYLCALPVQSIAFFVPTFSRVAMGVFLPFLYILSVNVIEQLNDRRMYVMVKGLVYIFMIFFYYYTLQSATYVPYISVFSEYR